MGGPIPTPIDSHHLEEICVTKGHKPVALLRPKHVAKMVEKLADTPAAANNRRKALRALFKWGFKHLDEVEHNPTMEVERVPYHSDGFHSWTPEEVAQYEKQHAVGTMARLALALLYFTACRREDAVRLGRQHIHKVQLPDGAIQKRLRYRQAKNEHIKPVDVDMPLPAELDAIIEATPTGNLQFLMTSFGKPYTVAGFGNAMRDWCDQANLHHCSAHGLRKARAAEIAESGATAHELMGVTGHQSLQEAERYTKAARRPKLADAALQKVGQSRKKAQ
jgi:integrase